MTDAGARTSFPGSTTLNTVPDAPTHAVHATRSMGAASTDPFQLRDGIVEDAALSGLRSRKMGRGVGTYQARQNNVRSSMLHAYPWIFMPLSLPHTAHFGSAYTDGGDHGRRASGGCGRAIARAPYFRVNFAD